MNFMATSRNPFCSNRLMMSPTNPRWTPSGLIMMKVLSLLASLVIFGVVVVAEAEQENSEDATNACIPVRQRRK
jgi:hypothetical protein